MLSGNCTEALLIQANVTIHAPRKNSLKRTLPLSVPSPRLLEQYKVNKARGEGQLRDMLDFMQILGFVRAMPKLCLSREAPA